MLTVVRLNLEIYGFSCNYKCQLISKAWNIAIFLHFARGFLTGKGTTRSASHVTPNIDKLYPTVSSTSTSASASKDSVSTNNKGNNSPNWSLFNFKRETIDFSKTFNLTRSKIFDVIKTNCFSCSQIISCFLSSRELISSSSCSSSECTPGNSIVVVNFLKSRLSSSNLSNSTSYKLDKLNSLIKNNSWILATSESSNLKDPNSRSLNLSMF
ncbi:hypothetical protein WICPIJ_008421 [Wickerhamomyces pijperi]|uniref:Uncharacterized protein n=1 Tax=Wickerhamomyces pijperi TaxID=599730 RepID=A0A9P8PYT6_WICPI|nr:hypothetical protein WICPIJ_008421 [Wickerhamomyces pijperi]